MAIFERHSASNSVNRWATSISADPKRMPRPDSNASSNSMCFSESQPGVAPRPALLKSACAGNSSSLRTIGAAVESPFEKATSDGRGPGDAAGVADAPVGENLHFGPKPVEYAHPGRNLAGASVRASHSPGRLPGSNPASRKTFRTGVLRSVSMMRPRSVFQPRPAACWITHGSRPVSRPRPGRGRKANNYRAGPAPIFSVGLQNQKADVLKRRVPVGQADDDHVSPLVDDLQQIALLVAAHGRVELVCLLRKLHGAGHVSLVEPLEINLHLQVGIEVAQVCGRLPPLFDLAARL